MRTDAPKFFADKHVNVVTPLSGAFSYYTDWERPDPGLAKSGNNNGVNMWTTFLTEELPPVIDSTFGTTGENALAGLPLQARRYWIWLWRRPRCTTVSGPSAGAR